MRRYLFTFENGKVPPAVVLATGALIAILAVGIVYQLLSTLVL